MSVSRSDRELVRVSDVDEQVNGQTGPPVDLPELARQMTSAAVAFLESLSSDQRAAAISMSFDGPERTEWTYLPGPRPGVPVADLTIDQRRLAYALLLTSYSIRGRADAERVLRTEVIRERVPGNFDGFAALGPSAGLHYWLRLFGDPGSSKPWMWRLSGHHLVAQATVAEGTVSLTPQFFGAQPARILHGPNSGFRGLVAEEDLARELVMLLGEDQRRQAVSSPLAPADILTRDDPVAQPRTGVGLPYGRLDRPQRELLETLVRHYLDRAPHAVAHRAWEDAHQAGLEHVTFTWAGGTAAGQGHYYALTGPTFLLEYDNTQHDANHIHSVWRDLRRDWAGDVLARHYAAHPHC